MPAEYRLAVRAVLEGDRPPAWIVRNYRAHPLNVLADVEDFLDQVEFRFLPIYALCLTESVLIDRVEVAFSTAPSTVLSFRETSVAGELPDFQLMPSQISALIRLTYSGSDPRHPGKVFVPYVPIPNSLGARNHYVEQLDAFANYLAHQLGINRPDDSKYEPCVWHRLPAASSLITGWGRSDHYWTQRDRAPRPPHTDLEPIFHIDYTVS